MSFEVELSRWQSILRVIVIPQVIGLKQRRQSLIWPRFDRLVDKFPRYRGANAHCIWVQSSVFHYTKEVDFFEVTVRIWVSWVGIPLARFLVIYEVLELAYHLKVFFVVSWETHDFSRSYTTTVGIR